MVDATLTLFPTFLGLTNLVFVIYDKENRGDIHCFNCLFLPECFSLTLECVIARFANDSHNNGFDQHLHEFLFA